MPLSNGARTGLSYVVESVFGTTPVTPSLIQLPYTTHSLDLSKERVTGNDLLPDRMPRVDRHGNRSVAGDIVADLRAGDYDALLESAFFNAWATDVLKIGTTPKFFSFEDAALDIAQYRLFTGLGVSSLALSIRPNQMVTATFSMVGKDMTQSGSSLDAVKTVGTGNQPFDSYSGVLEIGNAGGALSPSVIVTGIDFTVTNSLAPRFVVGSDSTTDLEYGSAVVEGTITAYYEDASLINRFINEVESALEVTVDDPTGTNGYTFLFPRIKVNGATVPVEGPGSRVITLPFVALYDATENSNLVLTRA
jgi:Phage tail tube protein